jgi:hypothetical protein
MVILKEALIYGLFCGGLGVGLTMIRSIAPRTLPYVFIASFCCGFVYDYVDLATQITFLAADLSAFRATAVIRVNFERKKYNIYFGIVITSVFCICPGIAIANFFDGVLNMNTAVIQAKMVRVLTMGFGLSRGIIIAGLLFDRIYGRKIPEELR